MNALDPRSVANLILTEGWKRNKLITNLSLQKILYFVHGRYLVEENGSPLIQGSFEAWKYGPVCLSVYDAFKDFGGRPITKLAERKDIRTGELSIVELPAEQLLRQRITDFVVPYLALTAGRLVDLSHARGAPWDRATSGDGRERLYGLRISNESVRAYFKYHKISVSDLPRTGEPDEESPPDGN